MHVLTSSDSTLIQHIRREYDASERVVKKKHDHLIKAQKYENNIDDSTATLIPGSPIKIRVKLILAYKDQLKAVHLLDEANVKFRTDSIDSEQTAKNLNDLAKRDYELMNMSEKNILAYEDAYTRGVAIYLFDRRDTTDLHPRPRLMDPLSRYPDPYGNIDEGFAYHGFKLQIYVPDLIDNPDYKHLKHIHSSKDMDEARKKQNVSETRQLARHETESQDKYADVYRHTTIHKGKRHVVVLANDMNTIIYHKIYEPAKGQLPSEIPDGVCLMYGLGVVKGDPFGATLYDAIGDKQLLQQLVVNILSQSIVRSALGGIQFIEKKADIDPAILKKAVNNIDKMHYVPADLKGLNGSPLFVEAPKPEVGQDMIQLFNLAKQQAQEDIGLDPGSVGVQAGGSTTATEQARLQNNSNQRFALYTKIQNVGRRTFWETWYLMYKRHLKKSDTITLYSQPIFGISDYGKQRELTYDDIITSQRINPAVETKYEYEQRTSKIAQMAEATLPTKLNDPTLPEIAKMYAKRDAYRMSGHSDEQTMQQYPPSKAELLAKKHVVMINEDQVPEDLTTGRLFTSGLDLYTFAYIYQSARDTAAKHASLFALEMAMGELPEPQQAQPQGDEQVDKGVQNAQQNMMMANAIKAPNVPDLSNTG